MKFDRSNLALSQKTQHQPLDSGFCNILSKSGTKKCSDRQSADFWKDRPPRCLRNSGGSLWKWGEGRGVATRLFVSLFGLKIEEKSCNGIWTAEIEPNASNHMKSDFLLTTSQWTSAAHRQAPGHQRYQSKVVLGKKNRGVADFLLTNFIWIVLHGYLELDTEI